jgi:tyrosinase
MGITDPIFYLHHSQLDRLWWLWQQRDLQNRLHDYNGEGDSDRNVTLQDTLPLAGLDEDITVLSIMGTESGGMCYRYMYY